MADYRHSFSNLEDLAGKPMVKRSWSTLIRDLFSKMFKKK